MVIFSLKLLNNVRKAIAGRRFPHQLAGGVALGVLMGIIPHGNLLALIVLVSVLCFRVNHALLAVVAIVLSFGATKLDPYSHTVGEYLLSHPTGNDLAGQAWALPLVPWTNLNNTVVLGSFVIGSLSVLPIFALCLPLFRLVATTDDSAKDVATEPETLTRSDSPQDNTRTDTEHGWPPAVRLSAQRPVDAKDQHSVSLLVDPRDDVPPPRFASHSGDTAATRPTQRVSIPIGVTDATTAATNAADSIAVDPLPTNEQMVSVETRIDVIRMKDFRDDGTLAGSSSVAHANKETEQPVDEALNYLLRQLRHSQERKAAG